MSARERAIDALEQCMAFNGGSFGRGDSVTCVEVMEAQGIVVLDAAEVERLRAIAKAAEQVTKYDWPKPFMRVRMDGHSFTQMSGAAAEDMDAMRAALDAYRKAKSP